MKDQLGLYYYPAPENHRIRMYVRERFATVEFRMWNADYPEVWERHGWIPFEDIQAAAALYKEKGRGTDPMLLYDLNVAKRLVADDAAGTAH